MGVHSLHVFDRKGKTLFTKRYAKLQGPAEDEEQLSEQRKLVFGMLFSLREMVGTLAPETDIKDAGECDSFVFESLQTIMIWFLPLHLWLIFVLSGLHSIRTGAGTLHNFETTSGLRFALYTSNSGDIHYQTNASIRAALKHIYTNLWVDCVIRSPLYVSSSQGEMDISSTNFEPKLDTYLASMPWFK